MKSKIALAVAAAALAGALVLAMNGAAQAGPVVKPGECIVEGRVVTCGDPRGAVPLINRVQYGDYDARTYDPNYRERQEREREERREQRRERQQRERNDGDGERYRLPEPRGMDCNQYGECSGTYSTPHPDSARP